MNRLSLFFLLSIISTQIKAEFVADLYGGEAFTQKHNAEVNLPDAGIQGTHEALKFDSASTLGVRAAYWVETFSYLGLGLDASHLFGPDQRGQVALTTLCVTGFGCSTAPETIKKFNNNLTVIGLDVMLRYPLLVSEQFTKGKLQPYVSLGPALFIATLKDSNNFIPAGQSSTYTSLGMKVGAGLKLFLTKQIGTFIEYRDTNFQTQDKYNNASIVHGITLGKTLGKATFNIQSLLGGVSLRF